MDDGPTPQLGGQVRGSLGAANRDVIPTVLAAYASGSAVWSVRDAGT